MVFFSNTTEVFTTLNCDDFWCFAAFKNVSHDILSKQAVLFFIGLADLVDLKPPPPPPPPGGSLKNAAGLLLWEICLH